MDRVQLTEKLLDRLEDCARRATPGPWAADAHWGLPWEVGTVTLPDGYLDSNEVTDRVMVATTDVRQGNAEGATGGVQLDLDGCINDARFIAAANPAVVLALVAEVRRLRSQPAYEINERNEIRSAPARGR